MQYTKPSICSRILITFFPNSNDASVYTRRRIDYPINCLDAFAGEKTSGDWEGKLTVRPLFFEVIFARIF